MVQATLYRHWIFIRLAEDSPGALHCRGWVLGAKGSSPLYSTLLWLWYFSAWNFKTRYTKLDCPYGRNLWNLNYFFQYCIFIESRASEAEKIDFSKNEAIKFWESKSNFLVIADYKSGLIFWNCENMVIIWPNLESDNNKKSKFLKFGFVTEFHTFFWNKNTVHFNFSIKK